MRIVRLRTRFTFRPTHREAWLAGALLVVLVALPSHAVAREAVSEPPENASPSISGTATVDGTPADIGATLIAEVVTEASATPISCGTATLAEAGVFRMDLDPACEAGMGMRVLLGDLEAKDQIEVPPDSIEDVLVRFESPPPAGADSQISTAFANAEEEKARALIDDGPLIILLAFIALAVVALLALVAWRTLGNSAEGSKILESQAVMIPQMLVEGLVLSLAIIAIVVLGASAKLTSEGLVSVLAGIVGYAAGRSAAGSSRGA